MAQQKELKRRIKSIRNTAQTTKAMELVSAAKMRRAQISASNGRPYSSLINDFLSSLANDQNFRDNEFFKLKKEADTSKLIIFVSTDRGLSGSLNFNLNRLLLQDGSLRNAQFVTVGKKGRNFIVKSGKNLLADFPLPPKIEFSLAKTLAKLVIEIFLKGEISSVHLLYSHFESTLLQTAKLKKLLPVSQLEMQNDKSSAEYFFEPTSEAVLKSLIPHYIEEEIYQILLEAAASEHSSRMVAMKNATDNALELVDDLTLIYNQARQGAITSEILDIATASLSLE